MVHLSDVHFGAHRDLLVESLLVDVAAQRPDLVVVSGDWTQRARRSQFRQARAFLDRLPAPVLSVLGNHDVPLFDLVRRLVAPTGRYRRHLTPDLDPTVRLPGLVALGLASMPPWRWKAGHVSARQAEIVRDALGGGAPGAWRILVTHHPVLPAELSGLLGRRSLVDSCARAGVAVFLSGHTHLASATVVTLGPAGDRRQALSVVAGTATSTRTRGTPNSYAVLRLDGPMAAGAAVTVEVRRPTETGWTTQSTARFVATDDGVGAAPDVPA